MRSRVGAVRSAGIIIVDRSSTAGCGQKSTKSVVSAVESRRESDQVFGVQGGDRLEEDGERVSGQARCGSDTAEDDGERDADGGDENDWRCDEVRQGGSGGMGAWFFSVASRL